MKRIMLGLVLLLVGFVFISGCGRDETMRDNLMKDPSVLDNDNELQLGDAGLEDERAQGEGFRTLNYDWIRKVSPNPAIVPINNDYANNVIAFGRQFLGTPYEYGSDRNNNSTFDCSDFTRYAFLGALGMDIPKDSRSQEEYVKMYGSRSYVNLNNARRGDLLFFMSYRGFRPEDYAGVDKSKETITHVGIYLGNGEMLHTASSRTGGVRIDDIFGKHLEYRFVSGGSVFSW